MTEKKVWFTTPFQDNEGKIRGHVVCGVDPWLDPLYGKILFEKGDADLVATAPELQTALDALLHATMYKDHPAESELAIAALAKSRGIKPLSAMTEEDADKIVKEFREDCDKMRAAGVL